MTSFKGARGYRQAFASGYTARIFCHVRSLFMFSLTNPQKRQLKALAHPRKPVVIIGDNGLTDAVMQEIEIALDHHELDQDPR